MKIYALGRWHTVSSLKDASRFVRETTDSRGMGATEWYDRCAGRAGLVIDADGRPVAHVSYNGRIWAVDEKGQQLNRELKPRSNPTRSKSISTRYTVSVRLFDPATDSMTKWYRIGTYGSRASADKKARSYRKSEVGQHYGDWLQVRVVRAKRK